MKTIRRASLIIMKPCAVATKRDEMPKGYIGIVPHRAGHLNPPADAGGTDLTTTARDFQVIIAH